MKLWVVAAAVVAGVILAAMGVAAAWPALVLALGGAGFGLLFGGHTRSGLLLLSACLGAGLGIARYEAARPSALPSGVAIFNGSPAVLRGFVAGEPEQHTTTQRFSFRVEEVEQGGVWLKTRGDIQVTARPFPSFRYGERLQLAGELETPQSFAGFDYRDYLARQGIVAVTSYPSIQRLDSMGGNRLRRLLEDVRRELGESLQRALPEPEGALSVGILLGQRSGIPAEVDRDFNRAGISHLIAISGANVMLVAALVISALAWLIGFRRAVLIAMLAVAVFAIFVGAEPSVLRAAVMAQVVLGAKILGRPANVTRALVITTALLLLWRPLLLEDVAFQLSVAATFGIVLLAEPLQLFIAGPLRRVLPVKLSQFVEEGMAITGAASLAVLPVTLANFGSVSLVALPANLIAGLLFVPILALSTAVACLGLLSHSMAASFATVAALPASALILLADAMGGVSFAAVQIDAWRGSWASLLTILPGLALLRWIRKIRPGQSEQLRPLWRPISTLTALVLLAAAYSWWRLLSPVAPTQLEITILDVGQGDAILIEAPSGRRVLIDGGPSGQRLLAELAAALPRDQRRLDLLVLTHGQDDHVSGLVSVLQRYEVGAIASGPLPGKTAAYRAWLDELDRLGKTAITPAPGSVLDLGAGVLLEVLAPEMPSLSGNLNDSSLVLRLAYGGVSFLFTGDIEAEREEALLRYGDVSADVLKVAHHGSDGSSTESFLRAVGPRVAAISASADNPFGHPSPTTLRRLAGIPLLRTDVNGRILFITDGSQLWVEAERGAARIVEIAGQN